MTISRLDAILRLAAVVLAAVALAMLLAPAAIGSLFGVDSSSGGDFLARRYGASGMAALAAALWMAPGDNARRTVLIALAVWFAVQAVVVLAGSRPRSSPRWAWSRPPATPSCALQRSWRPGG